MKSTRFSWVLTVALLAAVWPGATPNAAAADLQQAACSRPRCVFLPAIFAPTPPVPTVTGSVYQRGIAEQYDVDNPVRVAAQHADKNLALRGLVDVTDNDQGYSYYRGLLNYGQDDNRTPQLPYLFSPARGAANLRYYRVRDWNWLASPAAGTPGAPIARALYPITGLGIPTTVNELIHAPRTLVDNPIAPGYNMMVIYADAENIALKYTVEDSAATGYTLHIRGIRVDQNLLNLYQSLDGGNRNVFVGRGWRGYDLPYLSAGQPIGFAIGSRIIVAIADRGTFLDPRSCDEFWVNFQGNCPRRDGNGIR
jgi:hypothetical protein